MKLFHKIPLFSGDGFPNYKSSGYMDVLWPDFWIELGHWAGKEIVDRGCLLPAQGHTIIYLAHQTILLTFLPHGNRREQWASFARCFEFWKTRLRAMTKVCLFSQEHNPKNVYFKIGKNHRCFVETRLWPAFGRQSLVGSSGGYTGTRVTWGTYLPTLRYFEVLPGTLRYF